MQITNYSCQILIKPNANFLDNFLKNARKSNFMKIRPVEAELLHADGHDESNGSFSQFCERA
jgi:hypothetical protein